MQLIDISSGSKDSVWYRIVGLLKMNLCCVIMKTKTVMRS